MEIYRTAVCLLLFCMRQYLFKIIIIIIMYYWGLRELHPLNMISKLKTKSGISRWRLKEKSILTLLWHFHICLFLNTETERNEWHMSQPTVIHFWYVLTLCSRCHVLANGLWPPKTIGVLLQPRSPLRGLETSLFWFTSIMIVCAWEICYLWNANDLNLMPANIWLLQEFPTLTFSPLVLTIGDFFDYISKFLEHYDNSFPLPR